MHFLKFENFLTMPNAELVHNDIHQKYNTMQISQSRDTKGQIYIVMKNSEHVNSTISMMIPISNFSRSNLFGLGDVTKISLYYFGTFANFTRLIVNSNKL